MPVQVSGEMIGLDYEGFEQTGIGQEDVPHIPLAEAAPLAIVPGEAGH